MHTAVGVATFGALLAHLLLPLGVEFARPVGIALALVNTALAALVGTLVCGRTPLGAALQLAAAFEFCLALTYLLTTPAAADLLAVAGVPVLALVAASAAVPPLAE